MSLKIDDIDGTKVGTKGLRAFKHYTRREFRDTNKIQDIPGAKVGSLLKAPPTKRVVNPLNPQYPLLGASEIEGNENNPYANNERNAPSKPSTAPVKTRGEEFKRLKVEKLPNLDKETYKRDLAKFYDTAPGFMQEIDFKQIKNA